MSRACECGNISGLSSRTAFLFDLSLLVSLLGVCSLWFACGLRKGGGEQHSNVAVSQQLWRTRSSRSSDQRYCYFCPLRPATLCWSHRRGHQAAPPAEAMLGLGLLLQPDAALGQQAASVSHISCRVSSGVGARPRRVQRLWQVPLTLQYLLFVLQWRRECCCTTNTE